MSLGFIRFSAISINASLAAAMITTGDYVNAALMFMVFLIFIGGN